MLWNSRLPAMAPGLNEVFNCPSAPPDAACATRTSGDYGVTVDVPSYAPAGMTIPVGAAYPGHEPRLAPPDRVTHATCHRCAQSSKHIGAHEPDTPNAWHGCRSAQPCGHTSRPHRVPWPRP